MRPYNYYDHFTATSNKPKIKYTPSGWETHYLDMTGRPHWVYSFQWKNAVQFALRVIASRDE